MEKSRAAFLCLMLLTMSLSGCLGGNDAIEGPDDPAGEKTPTILDDWNVHFAATSGDLPECGTETLGRLYFVSNDNEFQACTPAGWQTIDISGPPGAAGAGVVVEEGCYNTETGAEYTLEMWGLNTGADLKSLCEGFSWEFNEGDGITPGYCYNRISDGTYNYSERDCRAIWADVWWSADEEHGEEREFMGACETYYNGIFDNSWSRNWTWVEGWGGEAGELYCESFDWVEEVNTGFWECVNPSAKGAALNIVQAIVEMGTCKSFKWREGGSDDASGMNGNNGITPLITSTDATSCLNGGITFQIGMDLDGNGVLDLIETATTLDVCDGRDGRDGRDGANGTNGTAGMDGQDGSDGVDGQDGADGTSVNIVGSVATVGGLDSNYQGDVGDGYIVSSTGHLHIWDGSAWVDAGNITGPDGADGQDGINGTDGLNALISATSESAGANCANGGTKIQVGVDDDADGVLNATEVDHTQYICDGSDGSASANTMLTAQSNLTTTSCTWAERIIQSGLDNGDGGGTAANGVLESGEIDLTTTYCISLALPSLLKDIRAGGSSSNPDQLTAINSTLYFTANDGTNGCEIWKSDGTSSGTVMIYDLSTNDYTICPSYLTSFNSELYFNADAGDSDNDGTPQGNELWKTDGTQAGTSLVLEAYPTWGSPGDDDCGAEGELVCEYDPRHLTVAGSYLYFQAGFNEAAYGSGEGGGDRELWRTDGTTAGTVLVKDINSESHPDGGTSSSSPSELTAVGSTLYFSADDGSNGTELWKSDGTSSGTVMVKNIRSGSGSGNPQRLTAVGSTLYFRAYDSSNGTELWKTDGTSNGTVLVKDINSPTASRKRGRVLLVVAMRLF